LHSQALQSCVNQLLTAYDMLFLHVFAPVLVEYVRWVLDQAVSSGKKRLYFLARDGWMMYQVALALGRAGAPLQDGKDVLELRYLKGSRYAFRIAEYWLMGEACLDRICVGGIDITFEKLMKRAALTDEEACHVARLAGYEKNYRKPLNYAQIQEIKSRLKQIKIFFKYVHSHSRACYKDTVGYFQQEGLLQEIPYAIVDSGWIGTIQSSLERLLSEAAGKLMRLEGYYFGLYEIPKNRDRQLYHPFYITPEGTIRRKTFFSICLFEALCSSPEGMTLGYREWEGHYSPTESKSKNPNAALMERSNELLTMYSEAYAEAGRQMGNVSTETPDIEKLLSLCMGSPTKVEAEELGSLLFCDDVLELQMQPVAAEWDEEEIKKQRFLRKLLIKLNIRREELHESGWPEGSITLAEGHVTKNLRQERIYKRFMYIRKAIKTK